MTNKNAVATITKAAIRTLGVTVVDPIPGVGESVKEDINGLYKINSGANDNQRANEIVLHNRITTKLVYSDDSPFELKKKDDIFSIYLKGSANPILDVQFSKRPEHYKKQTTKGTPMKYIGQAMGADCLAIAVDKQCHYFLNGTFCRYCNITPTNKHSAISRQSNHQDIKELIDEAGKRFRFFDLTGGTFANTDEEAIEYTKIGAIIHESLGRNFSGPFSLTPPKNLNLLEKLYDTGVDVISFNRDIWNSTAWEKICPGKSAIGQKHFDDAYQKAKEIWGEGNIVAQFLAGPWESNESLLEGVKYYLDRGILVNITCFAGSPGSTFQGKKPKTLKEILDLFIRYGEMIKEYGYYPNKRNSILTSESANRSSIANEVAKQYLTRESLQEHSNLISQIEQFQIENISRAI